MLLMATGDAGEAFFHGVGDALELVPVVELRALVHAVSEGDHALIRL